MNAPNCGFRRLLAVAVASVFLAACASPLTKPEGAETARNKLNRLQSEPQLISHATVEFKDAELAVRHAEKPESDRDLARHRVVMADRMIDIAANRAQRRLYEDQRKMLSEQSDNARLAARTREADTAHRDADQARMDTDAAQREAADLRQQIAELNAQTTDRGLVLTLGDVLFQTGRSELRGDAPGNLGKLVAFLNQHPERTVAIEGHTDSIGSESANFSLSQRRADSVKSFLTSQGVDFTRLQATGMGEDYPVASNGSVSGRQQNRRVEVIISNPSLASR